MKVLTSGILTGVTGAKWSSGVSTPPIDLSIGPAIPLGIWLSIEGDLARTGGSVAVIAKGCYQRSGTTYAPESTNVLKSGTSKSGLCGNGSYWIMKNIVAPFMKLEAVASKSGSSQHGSGTSNSCVIRYAIMGF